MNHLATHLAPGIVREERIGGQRLILGDSLLIVPSLEAMDAMLTDPPYGIGKLLVGSGHFAGLAKKMGGEYGWDNSPPPSWIFENNYPTIVWGGNYLGLRPSRGWLAWVKTNAAPTFASIELAWANMDFNAKHWVGPCGAPVQEKVEHPTQKPVALMEWCLGFLPNAQTILDPFMGSGTTLVACQRLGRNGTGIELDPEYFDIACRRVDEATRQPDLFVKMPAKPSAQETLL
jgi:DNA modification methylase